MLHRPLPLIFVLLHFLYAVSPATGASMVGGNEPRIGRADVLETTSVASRRPALHLDRSVPFYPRYGDSYLFLLGVSDRAALTIWQNDKGFDWQRYLNELAAHGFNYVRQDVTAWTRLASFRRYPAQFSQPQWAFARTGPGTAVDGGPRFDLTRLNEVFFQERLIPFLREAERRRIIVELTLFDDCRSRRAFIDSLYADGNNRNKLGLEPGCDPHADESLVQARLLHVQENYVDRVLEATSEFGNVIYEIANETGGAQWVEHFVDYIHRRRPNALVSAGEQSSPYDPVAGRCDAVVKHRGQAGLYSTNEDIARHRQSLMHFRRGAKPVLHNEFFLFANRSTDDPNFVRKMFWADFTGGGHVNFFDFTWLRGTGRTIDDGDPSRSPPREIMGAGKFLRRFIDEGKVPFETMEPHDELAKAPARNGIHPFVFAKPAVVYVVYLVQGGAVTLDFKPTTRRLRAQWYNPRRGDFLGSFSIEGHGEHAFETPDQNDWVLLLKVEGAASIQE